MTPQPSQDGAVQRTSADALLESMERVRALAGQVVRQAADRDDLVQEAVARALTKPSTVVGDSGPWMRRVVGNLGIDRQRSAARRKNRELDAGDAAAVHESALDAVARAELQRDIVDTVLSLPEPYRAVILARFFDGLPPREIAKQLDRPVATVKKQQERGMALLRKELEGRYGQGGAWAVALLPILPKSTLKALAAKSAGSGLGTMAPRWVAFASAAVAGVALPVFLSTGSGTGERIAPVAPLDLVQDEAALSAASPRDSEQEIARSVAAVPETVETQPASTPELRTFTGRFVDALGAPVPDVTAICRPAEEGAVAPGQPGRGSDEGVVFASLSASLDLAMVVEVEAQGFAPAVYRFASETGELGALMDVGRQTLFRPVDLEVAVVDEAGTALTGWEMSYFHYGGGQRLERASLPGDPATGRATFVGVASAEVEVMAKHPSGLELHRPKRALRAGDVNRIELVHLGSDPARRVGVELEWPPMAEAPAQGDFVSVALHDGTETVGTAEVALGAERASFEDVAPGGYAVRVNDPRFAAVEASVEPGASATLALRSNAQLALTLRDTEGMPLKSFAAEVLLGQGAPTALARIDSGSLFEGPVPGQAFVLVVRTADGRQAATEVPALEPRSTRVIELTLGEGMTIIRVQVLRGRARVPVVGAEVALFEGAIALGSEDERLAVAQLRTQMGPKLRPRASRGELTTLARAQSGVDGVATLHVMTHELGEAVTAVAQQGDHGLALVQQGGARLVLSDQGAVVVRAEGLPSEWASGGALPDGVALTLSWPGSVPSPRSRFGPGLVLERDEDGLFATDAAPAGPATVWLSLSDFNHTGRGTPLGAVTGPVGYPVASVDVPAGGSAEVTVRLAEFWPGRVEVMVRHAGQVLGDAVVELEPVGSHAHLPYPFGSDAPISRTLSQLTDGSGRALFPRVPKGQWRLRIRDIEWLWVTTSGEIDVASGGRETARVEAELAEAEVALVDAETGVPLARQEVVIELAPHRTARRMTDDQGRLRLHLGPGSYGVTLPGAAGAADRKAQLDWQRDGPRQSALRLGP